MDRWVRSHRPPHEPSLAVVALAFMFCAPLGLYLAFNHSAFRSGGKRDPVLIGALVALGVIAVYMLAIVTVEMLK